MQQQLFKYLMLWFEMRYTYICNLKFVTHYFMIDVHILDETALLKAVILGSAKGIGEEPDLKDAYDPKSKMHIAAGTFPKEKDMVIEMDAFESVLKKHGVEVYRPEVLQNYNQIFSRDIGFVIDDKFVKPRILKNRKREIEGIQYILNRIPKDQIVNVPAGVQIEGGDVMPWQDYIFVGYSKHSDFDQYIVARTNEQAVQFLTDSFPNKTVKAFELHKSDDNAYDNALHLDCCFQPVGTDKAIIHKEGFKKEEDYNFLVNYFGQANVFDISKEEMFDMNSNVFSISPTVVVSEKGFTRLNNQLRDWGITVEEIGYSEIAKMEGLLRCSTLPLKREY